MVIELADHVIAPAKMRPAEERVGLRLHRFLSFGGALAVVAGRFGVRQIRRVGGGRLLFDLQKQRIAGAVSFKVNAVVAQAHRADSDNLESHVHRAIERQEMLALRLERLAIRYERGKNSGSLPASEASENWLDFLEAARRIAGCPVRFVLCPILSLFFWRKGGNHRPFTGPFPWKHRLGQLLQRVLWCGSFSLEEGIEDRLNLVQAMNLKSARFERRHLGKCAHLCGVAVNKSFHGLARRSVLVSRFAPGHNQGCGHALQVPLERAADGLIEVVDVENQPAVGRRIRAQVAHVGVAAELADNAG